MMKTNAKRKNSAAKKLIPAAGMLALSASMLATSTYAWFTMNKYVTVTGMEVKTTVSSNLLISHDILSNTAKNDEDTFVTSDSTSVRAWLQPVSSNTAASSNYWYTLDAAANGEILSGKTYVDYDSNTGGFAAASDSAYGNKFSQDYGVTKSKVNEFVTDTASAYRDKAVGYVDYVFQLKATNTSDAAESIYLTQLDLTYDGATDGNKAFRAAVFANELSSTFAADITETSSNFKGIYAPASANNQTPGEGVSGASATTEIANFKNGGSSTATELGTISAGATKYYKVVVRLWIEGEDTTCTSETFAHLTEQWALDMRLDLGSLGGGTTVNGETPVTALAMATTPANNNAGNGGNGGNEGP
jgi:ribosomal protein S17E